jgi:hypothetical protein
MCPLWANRGAPELGAPVLGAPELSAPELGAPGLGAYRIRSRRARRLWLRDNHRMDTVTISVMVMGCAAFYIAFQWWMRRKLWRKLDEIDEIRGRIDRILDRMA